MASIYARNLRKVFDGDRPVLALDDLSFEIESSRFVSIVGPSGCGKSTLLNILSGVEEPTSGAAGLVTADGQEQLGYVFQAPRLLPWRTVIDNMMFVQQDKGEVSRQRAIDYLAMVGLDGELQAYPNQLSGGMQQRVGIARAFAIEPAALLMDEPFSHLDAINARELRRELHGMWQRTHKTVVFVTHDVSEAVELSNRIIVLRKGGTLADDITIDLPFPRDDADPEFALYRASVLSRFDEIAKSNASA
jgi:NitT/TauT family transport system ATP-binding protein